MTNVTIYHHNTMGQFNSNNLRTQGSNVQLDAFDTLMTVFMFIIMLAFGILMSIVDKFEKKPVLPFTTYDTCSSTSISTSPTYRNTIRRVSSSDTFITSV